MRGSRKFCQRGSNFDNVFFLSWWGEVGSKYNYERAIIAIMVSRLRADYGPKLNTGLVALWFVRRSGPVLLKTQFLWFFRERRVLLNCLLGQGGEHIYPTVYDSTEALEGHFNLLIITYYLLLITYHLLLITYYLSLITYYLLLIISPGRVAQSVTYLATDVSLIADRKFDPGPVPYFRGDWSWNNFYGHPPPFRWIIQEGLLLVTSEIMCTKYWLTACSSLPRKICG